MRGLLAKQSGGFFAVALVVATIQAIKETLRLPWEVECQGINVSDAASGVGGDITIKSNGTVVMTVEVTERPVDEARLTTTLGTKISKIPGDYVFMVHLKAIDPTVLEQAERYFAQGHEVNFADIVEWIRNTLVSLGVRGRSIFQQKMTEALSGPDVPQVFKLAWNEELQKVL